MKPTILILNDFSAPHRESLAQCFTVLGRDDIAGPAAEEVLSRIRAVVTDSGAGLSRDLLARLPALEIVTCSSAGYESVDVDALSKRGIAMTNASEALLDDVADTAMLLLLASWRSLVAAHRHVESGDWGRLGEFPLQRSLRGKRLGIVGMGRIGQHLLGRARAFGLEPAYFNRTERPEVGIPFQPDLTDLAAWADILLVIVAGGEGTRGMIDERVIRALGPTGTLVNVSRGSVVDEPALIAALRDGGLGAAALDVFRNEPHPDPALTSLPNVTLLPHMGSATVETRSAMAQIVLDNLDAHFGGGTLRSVVVEPPTDGSTPAFLDASSPLRA